MRVNCLLQRAPQDLLDTGQGRLQRATRDALGRLQRLKRLPPLVALGAALFCLGRQKRNAGKLPGTFAEQLHDKRLEELEQVGAEAILFRRRQRALKHVGDGVARRLGCRRHDVRGQLVAGRTRRRSRLVWQP